MFQVPYLPIDPKDVGRDYEAVIRINSQSGKGGIAYILRADHGLDLPRALQVEFSKVAQEVMDREGKELTSPELWSAVPAHLSLERSAARPRQAASDPTSPDNRELSALLRRADGSTLTIEGAGNGPIDAFVDASSARSNVELLVHRLSRARGRARRGRDGGLLCRVQDEDGDDPRRRHRSEYRRGLAQGDAQRGVGLMARGAQA